MGLTRGSHLGLLLRDRKFLVYIAEARTEGAVFAAGPKQGCLVGHWFKLHVRMSTRCGWRSLWMRIVAIMRTVLVLVVVGTNRGRQALAASKTHYHKFRNAARVACARSIAQRVTGPHRRFQHLRPQVFPGRFKLQFKECSTFSNPCIYVESQKTPAT